MKGEPMGDCMNFPDTVDEYMEQYKMTDVRQVYSNGIEYVPIFRMKQWFEHKKAQLFCEGTTEGTASDLISRQAAIDALDTGFWGVEWDKALATAMIKDLPPAQPEPKEGHWINGKCNLCGEHAPFWAMASTYHESKYCPHCGAKMKGERQ